MVNLSEGGPREVGADGALCVPEAIAAQAAQTPDRLALVQPPQALSYAALERGATQWAGYLRRLGAGPETVVAVCLPRTPALLVALLGIWKSGAAFLPLDPAHPPARLAALVRATRARVVLTERALASRVAGAGVPVVALDAIADLVAGAADPPRPRPRAPAQLAYVIYTSGSTGRPKGVMITHAALRAYIAWCHTAYGTAPGYVPVHTSIAYDLGLTSLVAPLAAGQTLWLVPQADGTAGLAPLLQPGADLALLKVTPAHLALLASVRGGPLPRGAVRTLVVGGEALHGDQIRDWLGPATHLFNEYGPTEATVGCCVHAVRSAPSAPVPIGHAIPGTRLSVMAAAHHAAPPGQVGELWIGGAGLARGYWAQPGLTAARFVPDPGAPEPGARAYRTGDLVRLRPDGALDFLGRRDDQIKLRGHRIELGEIDSLLAQHPAIAQCAVTARETEGGATQLVAYVVVRPHTSLPADQLRAYLREMLPEYMVPTDVVPLSHLPLTPNGKIDRQSLSAANAPRAVTHIDPEPPRTEAEMILARIWCEVLKVDTVGPHDNFFQRGGDSILSLKVVSRAKQAGLRITPHLLFEHQTLAALAGASTPLTASVTESPGVADLIPLSPIQHWFFDQTRGSTECHQAVLFTAADTFARRVWQQAIDALVLHHEALRARFTRQNDMWFQRQGPATAWLSEVDLGSLSPDIHTRVAARVRAASHRALNLESGAIVCGILFRHGTGRDDALWLIVHHLVVDGVSWRILADDLDLAVTHAAAGRPIDLGPRTDPFGRWVERLVQRTLQGAFDDEWNHWLAPADVSDATRDSGPEHVATHNDTAVAQFALSADETSTLRRESYDTYGLRLHEVVIFAIGAALARWRETSIVVADVEGHGRDADDDIDLSRTVGWFTSLYPVRLDYRAGSLDAQLLAIKRHLRTVPRGGVGYGALRYLHGNGDRARRLRQQRRADVSINYLGQYESGGAETRRVVPDWNRSDTWQPPGTPRQHALQLAIAEADARLFMTCTYSPSRHDADAIARFTDAIRDVLGDVRMLCANAASGRYTIDDFAESGLSEAELEALVERHSRQGLA